MISYITGHVLSDAELLNSVIVDVDDLRGQRHEDVFRRMCNLFLGRMTLLLVLDFGESGVLLGLLEWCPALLHQIIHEHRLLHRVTQRVKRMVQWRGHPTSHGVTHILRHIMEHVGVLEYVRHRGHPICALIPVTLRRWRHGLLLLLLLLLHLLLLQLLLLYRALYCALYGGRHSWVIGSNRHLPERKLLQHGAR